MTGTVMTTNPYLASISMKPKCNAYHDMELQNDGKGWNCDKCKTSHFNEDRWLCKTNGCDSDICVQCISQSGHVNNGDDKDGKEGEEQSAESEKKERKCEKKDIAIFKSFFLIAAMITLAIWAFSPTYASRLQLNLSNCPKQSYNAVATWPVATADFYKNVKTNDNTGLLTTGNITTNAEWYFNEEPCVGWVFNSLKGFCPMAAAYVKVHRNKYLLWEGSYPDFLKENPSDTAPKCVDGKSRRKLKTSSSNNSQSSTPSATYSFRECIANDDASSDKVFSTMTTYNKKANVKGDNTMTEIWDSWKSSTVYGKNAVIAGFIFLPISLLQLRSLCRPHGRFTWLVSLASLVLAVMYTGLISNVFSSINDSTLITSASSQWDSMFPGCTVKVDVKTSNNLLITVSITLIAINAILQIFVTYTVYKQGVTDPDAMEAAKLEQLDQI